MLVAGKKETMFKFYLLIDGRGGKHIKCWVLFILSNIRSAVGGRNSHTNVCFMETGGANKAPLYSVLTVDISFHSHLQYMSSF